MLLVSPFTSKKVRKPVIFHFKFDQSKCFKKVLFLYKQRSLLLTNFVGSKRKTQTVLSKEPEASRRPSQFQSTEWTLQVWPPYSRTLLFFRSCSRSSSISFFCSFSGKRSAIILLIIMFTNDKTRKSRIMHWKHKSWIYFRLTEREDGFGEPTTLLPLPNVPREPICRAWHGHWHATRVARDPRVPTPTSTPHVRTTRWPLIRHERHPGLRLPDSSFNSQGAL
jgi:hypothetical protein